MASVEEKLVDHDAGLIRLLDPPLAHAEPSAGYIQAYPPGVRENGGQYSHAGVWALMAQAELGQAQFTPLENGDLVYRYFSYLNPAHRSRHPVHGPAYGIEPYVMAGDVYTKPPYVGRGGWSWYTGAAAWLHRAAVSSMFGLRQRADDLCFAPCLPSHWPSAELVLRREGRTMRFIFMRVNERTAREAAASQGAQLLRPGELLRWGELGDQSCHVIPVLREPAAPAAPAPQAAFES
jgi:cyclic beta-1,2-glucan synthetase